MYRGMAALMDQYKDQGLTILLFPCNQFLRTEPWAESDIKAWVEKNYSKEFTMFSKVLVNGDSMCDVYQFLKTRSELYLGDDKGTQKISVPYAKFLVDGNGQTVKYFSSWAKPSELKPDIEKLLKSA